MGFLTGGIESGLLLFLLLVLNKTPVHIQTACCVWWLPHVAVTSIMWRKLQTWTIAIENSFCKVPAELSEWIISPFHCVHVNWWVANTCQKIAKQPGRHVNQRRVCPESVGLNYLHAFREKCKCLTDHGRGCHSCNPVIKEWTASQWGQSIAQQSRWLSVRRCRCESTAEMMKELRPGCRQQRFKHGESDRQRTAGDSLFNITAFMISSIYHEAPMWIQSKDSLQVLEKENTFALEFRSSVELQSSGFWKVFVFFFLPYVPCSFFFFFFLHARF